MTQEEKTIQQQTASIDNTKDTNSIAGQNTSEIKNILGYCDSNEVIHADDLAIDDATEKTEGEKKCF